MTADVTKKTEEVFQHHLGAFMKAATEGAAAVPEILTDYTEQSVILTPDGPVTGLAGIKAFLEGFISSVPADFIPSISPKRQEIHGEIAYILWSAEPYAPLGTDTFMVRDGKIVTQTFAAYMPS